MGFAHGDFVASADFVAVPSSGLRPDSLRSDPGRTFPVPDGHLRDDGLLGSDHTT